MDFAKSILDSEGNTLYGWVGGGCAEEAVRDAAMDSLKDGQTRIVPLDLDDASSKSRGTIRV